MEGDTPSNPCHQTETGEKGWQRQRRRNRKSRGKKNTPDSNRKGGRGGSSSRRTGDRRGLGRIERNRGRSQRAIIDSDDASAASSVDSDIARDYVANLLNDKDEDAEEDAHSVAALDAAASKESKIHALVQYAQASTTLLEVDDEVDGMEDMESNGVRRRRRRGKRGASQRDKEAQSPGDKKPPLSSLYGKPVEGKGKDMLQRMGWEDGVGLGAKADGRIEPIDVSLQRSRRGLGT